MNALLKYLPDIDGEELFYLDNLLKGKSEEQIKQFSFIFEFCI